MKCVTVLLWLAGSLFAAAPQPAGWVVLFQDDFENPANLWDAAKGDVANASWQRMKDGDNTVYAGQGSLYLTLANRGWSDFRFRSRVKLTTGYLNINYRLKYAFSRYFVTMRSDGLQLSRTLDTWASTKTLVTASARHASDTWYEVEIVGAGGNIKTYVDGVLRLEYTDPDPLGYGGIAFECGWNSRVLVDDVEVSGPRAAASQPWTKLGGPPGGIGYDVRMRPDNPDIMFATDIFSGVSKSIDGGRTWFSSNAGITSRSGASGDAVPIFCLTIDPHNPDVVWAGAFGVRGVFKSANGGESWVEKTSGMVEISGIFFRGITVDPKDPDTVYAAAEIQAGQGYLGQMGKGVVYRTRNGGGSWTAVWRGDNLARYVWVDPRNSDVLYVSTGIFDREAANADFARNVPGGIGILKSTDGGLTWRTLNAANGLDNLYVGSLFLHPQNPNVLLAGCGMNTYKTGAGVYLSTDQGEHWRRGTLAGSGQPVDELITSVEFATSDPRVAYAAGDFSFFRSEDGGVTWSRRAGGPPLRYYGPPGFQTGFPVDLQVDPRNPDRVFINNYAGGNFLSEDGGRTWQVASRGYTGAQVRCIAVDPTDEGSIHVASFIGPTRSVDLGNTWGGLMTGPSMLSANYSVALDPGNPSTVLGSNQLLATIVRSVDGGATWKLVFSLPPSSAFALQGFKAFAFAPSNPRTVYAGLLWERNVVEPNPAHRSYGLYKSTDGGLTWLESNDEVSGSQSFNMLAVDPRNESYVYAGTRQSGVLRSTDAGRTWQKSNQGLPVLDVRAIALNPREPRMIYAGLERGGIYKSIDAGATWQRSVLGMDPQASVRDIVVDPADPQNVYASDVATGVYRSTDGGKTWTATSNGLTTRAVNSLAISSDGGTLYAGTDGEGVFRLDLIARNGAPVTATSAAHFAADAALAPASIASVFGIALAERVESAPGASLPSTIGDTGLTVVDVAGAEKAAPLFFVSPGQVNFVVPPGLTSGPAVIRVFRQNKVVARGTVQIDSVAPGIFTANANGQGAPAALAARYGAGGAQTAVPVFQCSGTCAPVAMDLGEENEQLILSLYATGLRAAREVTATIGGVDAPVLGFAAQSQYAGLDQVNVRVPRELKGRGEVDLLLRADQKAANIVRVRFQ